MEVSDFHALPASEKAALLALIAGTAPRPCATAPEISQCEPPAAALPVAFAAPACQPEPPPVADDLDMPTLREFASTLREVDSAGMRWDARLHVPSRARNAEGTWRLRARRPTLDANGEPWNSATHARTCRRNLDGTWRTLRAAPVPMLASEPAPVTQPEFLACCGRGRAVPD